MTPGSLYVQAICSNIFIDRDSDARANDQEAALQGVEECEHEVVDVCVQEVLYVLTSIELYEVDYILGKEALDDISHYLCLFMIVLY